MDIDTEILACAIFRQVVLADLSLKQADAVWEGLPPVVQRKYIDIARNVEDDLLREGLKLMTPRAQA